MVSKLKVGTYFFIETVLHVLESFYRYKPSALIAARTLQHNSCELVQNLDLQTPSGRFRSGRLLLLFFFFRFWKAKIQKNRIFGFSFLGPKWVSIVFGWVSGVLSNGFGVPLYSL